MPHLSGVFDEFPDLDKIPIQNLSTWLRFQIDRHALINYLGNRSLYPQTVPVNNSELEIDLAILREGIRQRPAQFYEPQTNKLFIPELFPQRFPPIERLAGVVIEAINPKGVIEVYLKSKSKFKLLGTLICPPDKDKLIGDKNKVKITVNGVEGELKAKTMSISGSNERQIGIKLGDKDYLVSGGELGVIIDLR